MEFEKLTRIRDDIVCGESRWYWPSSDHGAWTGPSDDWAQEHSVKYFKYLKGLDVVVTAGANCGLHTRFFAQKFKRVYAFEPDPLNFHCMVNNSQFPNVYKFQMALGEECRLVDIANENHSNVGVHTIKEGNKIPMITIDTMNLDACDLIQLDVEGYEPNVIKGALETIKKFWPVITAENGHNCEHILFDLGYKVVDQSRSDKVFAMSSE